MKKEKLNKMIKLIFEHREFVVLDIETTGYSPQKGSKIIEIGAIVIKSGKIIETYQRLINPEIKIPAKIVELTGITDEMVSDKYVYGKVLNEFYEEIIKDRILVMHNSSFDWDRHLIYYLNTLGIFPDNEVIDTMVLSKDVYKDFDKHNLEDICTKLSIINEQEHRAISDAKATNELLSNLMSFYNKNVDQYLVNTNFLEDIPKTEYAKKKLSHDYSTVKIKRIKYWKKAIGKDKLHERIYVGLNFGDVYFDINSETWFLKEMREGFECRGIDFKQVESKVLLTLNLETREQLCAFRN